jgi:ribosomal protein L35
MRKQAFKAHILEKKSAKRKAALSRRMVVFKGDAVALRSMIPYA